MSSSTMTRHAFLAGGAACVGTLGLGIALGGMTARPQDAQAEENQQDAAYSEHVSPIDPVEPPDTWDAQADVLVIGTGPAGSAAAVAAAEEGASVIVLERGNIWGGNGQFSTGFAAYPTQDPDVVYNNKVTGVADAPVNSSVMKTIAHAIPDVLEWLRIHGEGFMKYELERVADGYPVGTAVIPWPVDYEEPDNPSYYEEGWYQWFPHNGAAFVNTLRMAADKLGVDVRYGAYVTNLVVQDDVVAGARVQLDGGSTIHVKAARTILATGGYSANYDLLKHYMTPEYYPFASKYAGTPLAQGDGIRMAQGLGAKVTSMDRANIEAGGTYDPKNMGLHTVAMQMNRWPSLAVNILGRRFADESRGNWAKKNILKCAQPQATFFTLLDATMVEPADVIEKFSPMACEFPTSSYKECLTDQLERGIIMQADTIEELAGLMNVDAASLEATVARYNELCEQGADDDFGKAPELMHPISTPPFYATKGRGGVITNTIGGLCYDEYLRVIDEMGLPIEGLFCAGETAAFLNCLSNAYPSGRYAGQMAAREALGIEEHPVPIVMPAQPGEGTTVETWPDVRTTPEIPADGCNTCHGVDNFRARDENHETYATDTCMTCHEENLFVSMEPQEIPLVPHDVPVK